VKIPIPVNVLVHANTGNISLLAANATYYYELRGYKVTGDGTGVIRFRDGASNYLTEDYLVQGGGVVLPGGDWKLIGNVAGNNALTIEAGSINTYGNVLIWKWPV
jgi:hypothetical protein